MMKKVLLGAFFLGKDLLKTNKTKYFSVNFKSKAFTLPELLLAAAILAFAVSSILLAFISCMVLNEMNRNLTTATSHAQFVLEEIKDTNFNAVKGCTGNCTAWDWSSTSINSKGIEALPNESIDTTVSLIGSTLLDVTVRVGWKDRGLRSRNVTLETLIAEP